MYDLVLVFSPQFIDLQYANFIMIFDDFLYHGSARFSKDQIRFGCGLMAEANLK